MVVENFYKENISLSFVRREVGVWNNYWTLDK